MPEVSRLRLRPRQRRHGPTSAEGKAKVSLKAHKTGLTGLTVLLRGGRCP